MNIYEEITENNKEKSIYFAKYEDQPNHFVKSDNCERDCKKICVGCNKFFCEIKDEFNCKHDEELEEAITTNGGEHFCHYDCLESYYG